MSKTYGYARCSTTEDKQDINRQIRSCYLIDCNDSDRRARNLSNTQRFAHRHHNDLLYQIVPVANSQCSGLHHRNGGLLQTSLSHCEFSGWTYFHLPYA